MLLGAGNNMEALEILLRQCTFFSLKKKKGNMKPVINAYWTIIIFITTCYSQLRIQSNTNPIFSLTQAPCFHKIKTLKK